MLHRLTCLAVALLAPVVLAGAPQVNVATLGPQVGQVAPPLSLTDQQGQTRTIAGAAGPKGTMVVFFRSADW